MRLSTFGGTGFDLLVGMMPRTNNAIAGPRFAAASFAKIT
jgi:hypothetical protein